MKRLSPRSLKASKVPLAVRRSLPHGQEPQLCSQVEDPPDGEEWVSEIKFDGYRLLATCHDDKVALLTRNGHDWTLRLPSVADLIRRHLLGRSVMLDGELVSLRKDGVSSFPGLQTALREGRDDTLVFYVFDLLHLDGWDLRACGLLDRKRLLADVTAWDGKLRYSDHHRGEAHAMRRVACGMHLEGIICKRADAPYRAGRSGTWVKVKCSGREEFVVLGWTPPSGSRPGIGAVHVGYRDPEGRLHYAGGVGSGFDDKELLSLRKRLDKMTAPPPVDLMVAGDPIDEAVTWVRPEIVVEVQYTAWSGSGRVRHPVFLGIREDKEATDVVHDVADPEAARTVHEPGARSGMPSARKGWHGAVPPLRRRPEAASSVAATSVARGVVSVRTFSKSGGVLVGGVLITHPDRDIWPGVTKRQLAEYWLAVSGAALPGIAGRPLSILRCPDGVAGEKFFQKNGHGHMPPSIRQGHAEGQPFLAVDDVTGLLALIQMSAVEIHPWGAEESAPTEPDHLVFDLDPGEGVPFTEVVKAARDTRDRLARIGLTSFCRTTGGKGLHVVVPVTPEVGWSEAKPFCRAFAETMAREEPRRFLAHLKIADRKGRILVDWLRNGLGSTAVASFSPRARPGAHVATPLAWREVTAKLEPASFHVFSVPARLARARKDPWEGYGAVSQEVPRSPAAK